MTAVSARTSITASSERSGYGRGRLDDPYTYEGLEGWRRFRFLSVGRGMYNDIRRRLPFYPSDVRDARKYRTFSGAIRIYFVNLLPAIAYMLDMRRRTDNFYGLNEVLLASAIAALTFSILGAQPLTIVGVTGLISLFNYTVYDILKTHHVAPIFPSFMCWSGIWAAIAIWILAACNTCDYMRYATDFSSEPFGVNVGIIYIIKGIAQLVFEVNLNRTAGFLGVLISVLFCVTVSIGQRWGETTLWTNHLRVFVGNYAILAGTIIWTGFSHIPGPLKSAAVLRVPIAGAFDPTQDRAWLIPFWRLPVKWVFAAFPVGLLVAALFYYDHNASSLTAQARQFPLKKPAGFHWDFFLLGCVTFICALLGLPFPNALVPQAPVHTDALTIYETKMYVIPTEEGEGAELRRPVVKPRKVIEQRVSHFIMAAAIFGTMTGPMLRVIHTMPTSLFSGVFFIVGWGSIEANGMLQKLDFLMREHRFVPAGEPLLTVRKKKIVLYLALQVAGLAITLGVSYTFAAIGFPIITLALLPIRVWCLPRWFTQHELSVMDDLTAANGVVLASLGGEPHFPERVEPWKYGQERKYGEETAGVPRQRTGSIHR